jgi:hemolysin D
MTATAAPSGAGLFGSLARHWAIWREAWRAENTRPRRDLRGSEREFLPAAIEIMERPASPVGRALIWSLCAFFAIATAWSIVGHIDIVAVAQGKVVPRGHTKVVQPLEIGVVRAIYVKDGDHVTAGQKLIDLDPTEALADRDRLDHDRLARALDEARLTSLLKGGPQVAPPQILNDAPADLRDASMRMLDSQWADASAKYAALDGALDQRRAELRMAEADRDRLQAVVPLLRDRNDRLGGLAEHGYTSKIQASQALQQLIEGEKNLIGAIDKVHQTEAAVRSAGQQRQQVQHETESGWRKDRADAIDKRVAAEQDILKAAKRRELQTLAAPIDGTVTNLSAWTVGGVVKPGDTILNVVPLSATPEIEAQVLNKDIGFIAAGQKVTVKFDAFSFTRYGTVSGEVVDVSRDANKDDKLGLIYPVQVRLDASSIAADGRQVEIAPGMSVNAEIITGDRRVIEYVLSPLLRYRHEAGRER